MIARRAIATLALLGALTVADGASAAGCELGKIAELAVTMTGRSPVVTAKINGVEERFLADSGAFYSFISPASAAELKLRLTPAPPNLVVSGIGGQADVYLTRVKAFTLVGVVIPDVQFLVGGSEPGSDVIGVLGQNVLGLKDTEYDLANGVIRLFGADGCSGKPLAYWHGSLPYSVLEIGSATLHGPHTAIAYVNGVKIRVLFDTGASMSFLSQGAAVRAGVTPQSPGVIPAGLSGGIGRRAVRTWIAPVASFKVGDEEVKNTRLRVADTSLPGADMLLGADFFLSHRVFVAKSQGKLYFTYNGGPVFNLAASPLAPVDAPQPSQPPASTAVAGNAPISADAPTDAAGFSRRGAASTSRRDFANAIADLNRAVALAPAEPEYLYERAVAYLGNHQPFQAMADLDQALKLKPDDARVLIVRAELRLAGRDRALALADLDAADHALAKQDDLRLRLGLLYTGAGAFAQAIGQYDLWIDAHPVDSRRAAALNGRCWARGQLGQDLEKAMGDCNAAIRLNTKYPNALDSRGLVHLRQGDLDKAIADYDASLALNPKLTWALYGRGLAKLRKGMTAEGKADIAAATALRATLPAEAKEHGLAP